MTIEEKCIEHLKDNDKLRFVTIPDMRGFAENHLGVKIKSSYRKNEIAKLLYDKLNVTTLGIFANYLEGFAFIKKDIITLFNVTNYRIDKLVDDGTIIKVGEFVPAGNKYISYYLYNINSCIKAYKDGKMISKQLKLKSQEEFNV